MQVTVFSLLPPILVLISAIITRKLTQSLILGLISGALIATDFQRYKAALLILKHISEQILDIDNIFVYIFLLFIGMLMAVFNYNGAAYAVATSLRKKITNKEQAQYTTFIISLLLALDDYLNCLTAGSVMQSLFDSFGIAREKLAYLIHTFAGPLVILIPISTWAAFITNQIEQVGISTTNQEHIKITIDPFYIYLRSIPCIYYGIFTIITALIIINQSISYGPMHTKETLSKKTKTKDLNHNNGKYNNPQPTDLLLPLATLLGTSFFGILYTGNFHLLGGDQSFINAFQNNQSTFIVLGIASIMTLLVSLLSSFAKKQISLQKTPAILWEGFMLMWPAVLLVILASSFGTMLRIDLQTGHYLATLLLHAMKISYVPAIFFTVSAIIGLLIGSAWGTIALLLPIGVSMAHNLLLNAHIDITPSNFVILVIGAILSGATFGDHTSAVAASGIMSATGAGCDPLEHVKTQAPYNVPPFIGSLIAFLTSGLLLELTWNMMLSISLVLGIISSLALTLLLNKIWKPSGSSL